MNDSVASAQDVAEAEQALRSIVAPLIAGDWSRVTTFGTRYDSETGAPYLLIGFAQAPPALVADAIPSHVPDGPEGVPVRLTCRSRVRFGG
jgi:hypothetical protein